MVVWCALVWASLPTLVAQNPCAIVRDLNQTPAPRSGRIEPRSLRAPGVEFGDDRMVAVGNALYFTAIDALHGQEVWCSDGTPGGTRLVVDINPGRSGSSPFRLQSVSLPAGPRLMFSAWDATGRSSVYLSDGTSAGTIRLAPTATTGVLLEAAATVGSRVVFGWGEPWVTDGTAASTRLLKEVMPGPGSSRASQFVAHPSGQFALFTATDGQHGIELWRTDGTPNGTVMVKDIVAGSGGSNPGGLVAHNGTVLFAVQNGLWRSDGTAAGTVQVAALSSVKLFAEAVVGNLLYFTASDTTVGTEVFQTDGTTAGTKVAVDLIPGRGGPLPRNLHGAGSKLYFTARPQGGSFQPFALQGSTLTPIGPMVGSPDKYTYIGGGVTLFTANDAQAGVELWRSDGTAAGTRRVRDLLPGSGGARPTALTAMPSGGVALMYADDGRSGKELWLSAGAAATTALVRDINPQVGTASGASRRWPSAVGTSLYLTADRGQGAGEEPHVLTEQDQLVSLGDLRPGAESSEASYFTPLFNGQRQVVVFSADDGTTGKEPWVTDGTAAGTRRLADLNPGTQGSFPNQLIELGDRVIFSARDAAGWAIWQTDGTAQGTTRIRASSSSGRLTAFRGRVVFTTPENNAQRFWITDGTPAGTRPFSTTTFDYVGPLAATEDKVFFLGGTRATGTEPHVMDTNGVGRLIKDVFPGSRAGAFILWGTANGRMFFRGRDANQTLSVWATDGTTAGTFSFQEEVRYFSSTPERAFFVPFRTGGIVASDGTPAGTVRASTGGSALAASGTGCYFVRREVSGGYVLMHFDARTGAVSSFCVTLPDHAGSSSQASWLRVAGSRLFFDGTHPVLGRELHAYRIVQPYSVSLGGACGANRATLRAQPPVLGQSMRFDVTESPMGVGALILGAPLSSPLPLPASAPCGMQLNLAGAAGIGGSSNRDWSVSFALPFRRELIGQAVNAQAFFIVPGPRLAEASNAVRLQLGN